MQKWVTLWRLWRSFTRSRQTSSRRPTQPGEGGKFRNVIPVGAPGFRVGDVGEPFEFRRHVGELAVHAQDNWRVTKRLTLDLGFRLYHLPPVHEINHQAASFDPSLCYQPHLGNGLPLAEAMTRAAH
jgi:hypothetical protein